MSHRHLFARSAEEAADLLATMPGAALLAGGTAAQLSWPGRPGGPAPGPVIDISRLPVGEAALATAEGLRLSALADLETLRRAPTVLRLLPPLAAMIGQVAATGVRTQATLGGNIGWRMGDLLPLLLVLDGTLEVLEPGGRLRRLPLAALTDAPLAPSTAASRAASAGAPHAAPPECEGGPRGAGPTALGAGAPASPAVLPLPPHVIMGVHVPLPLPPLLRFEKVARREAFAPSVLTVAWAGDLVAVGAAGFAARLLAPGARIADIAFPDDLNGTCGHRQRLLANLLSAWREEAA